MPDKVDHSALRSRTQASSASVAIDQNRRRPRSGVAPAPLRPPTWNKSGEHRPFVTGVGLRPDDPEVPFPAAALALQPQANSRPHLAYEGDLEQRDAQRRRLLSSFKGPADLYPLFCRNRGPGTGRAKNRRRGKQTGEGAGRGTSGTASTISSSSKRRLGGEPRVAPAHQGIDVAPLRPFSRLSRKKVKIFAPIAR